MKKTIFALLLVGSSAALFAQTTPSGSSTNTNNNGTNNTSVNPSTSTSNGTNTNSGTTNSAGTTSGTTSTDNNATIHNSTNSTNNTNTISTGTSTGTNSTIGNTNSSTNKSNSTVTPGTNTTNSGNSNGAMNNSSMNSGTMSSGTNTSVNSSNVNSSSHNAYNNASTSDIPATIQSSFQKDYPNVSNASWSQNKDWWHANSSNNGQTMNVYYNLKGQSYAVALPVIENSIPSTVVGNFSSKFSGELYDVTRIKAASGQDVYAVRTLNNGQLTTQIVDENGAVATNVWSTPADSTTKGAMNTNNTSNGGTTNSMNSSNSSMNSTNNATNNNASGTGTMSSGSTTGSTDTMNASGIGKDKEHKIKSKATDNKKIKTEGAGTTNNTNGNQ